MLRIKLLTLALAIAGLLFVLTAKTALADDIKIGCVVVGDDAGTTGFVTLSNPSQIMARCDIHNVRHRLGIGTSTAATSTDSILDGDKSIDICTSAENTRIGFYKAYDGGNPTCCVYKVKPRTGVCP